MSGPPGLTSQLSRRQFLHRAAIATAATALASGGRGIGHPGDAGTRPIIPRLDVPARVNGVASVGDRLVAVGGHLDHNAAQPVVWTHRLGRASWSLSATGSAFPPHTVLAAVAGIGETIVAAGDVHELSSVQTILDDSTGRPVHIPVFATAPAIFRSDDGQRWEQVLRGVPGSPLGAFGSVATIDREARCVAVGSRFLEPGISEGYGLIAVASDDGSTWESAELPGVVPPRHGAVTLLARLQDSTLLATRAIRDSSLYVRSGGVWRQIAPPDPRVSYTAAGQTERSLILAGVEDSGRHRIWTRQDERWRQADRLPGIPPGARLTDIEEVGDALVVAGSQGGRGFVMDTRR